MIFSNLLKYLFMKWWLTQYLLKEHKADIVLQFCDEGWMNNPKMELHVTAMLEVVGIPYTGTGPIGLGITSDKVH